MAVNVYAGQVQPIQFALTTGKNKTPITAFALTRVVIQLLDRVTFAVLDTVDSDITPTAFFWTRTQKTVKGVLVYLLELELHNSSLTLQEDLVARLTLYDIVNPAGVSWKQFALNSR